MPRIQSEEAYDTPRSSISEPRSPPQVQEEPLLPPPLPPPVVATERPKSACEGILKEHHDAWYPRRLSFSIAQDAIETWYVICGRRLFRQYPFEVQTDCLELEVDSINKWTEDQLNLVEVISGSACSDIRNQ